MVRAVAAAITGTQALVLGAVQGLTEFVPISSSGHLVLVPFLLRWPAPGLDFDVAVHLGTAVAVVAYFARDLWAILTGGARVVARRADDRARSSARLIPLLAVGSIPAALAGLFLEGLFHDLLADTDAVDRIGAPMTAVFLVVTAGLLWSAEAAHRRGPDDGRRGVEQVTVVDALVIGVFQALALAPGISRSGATIAAGIFRGLSREAAARFSFLLALPAIAGAGLLALIDLPPGVRIGFMLWGAVAAAVTGFAAIAFMLRYLRTRTLGPFAGYCVLAAAVSLGFWFQIK
jgi:undecaprenyl-diphosphatase